MYGGGGGDHDEYSRMLEEEMIFKSQPAYITYICMHAVLCMQHVYAVCVWVYIHSHMDAPQVPVYAHKHTC